MKAQRSSPFRYILIIILVLAAIRFLPLIVRLIQIILLGIRIYWWLFLATFIFGLIYLRYKKRVLNSKNAGSQQDSPPLRDVTNSLSTDSEQEKNSDSQS